MRLVLEIGGICLGHILVGCVVASVIIAVLDKGEGVDFSEVEDINALVTAVLLWPIILAIFILYAISFVFKHAVVWMLKSLGVKVKL